LNGNGQSDCLSIKWRGNGVVLEQQES